MHKEYSLYLHYNILIFLLQCFRLVPAPLPVRRLIIGKKLLILRNMFFCYICQMPATLDGYIDHIHVVIIIMIDESCKVPCIFCINYKLCGWWKSPGVVIIRCAFREISGPHNTGVLSNKLTGRNILSCEYSVSTVIIYILYIYGRCFFVF